MPQRSYIGNTRRPYDQVKDYAVVIHVRLWDRGHYVFKCEAYCLVHNKVMVK